MHKIVIRTLLLILIIIVIRNFQLFSQSTDTISYDVIMDDVLVTAQYKPTDIKNVLYNVDVINEKMISARGVTQLDQALLISPLVRIEQDMVLGSKIRFKGIDSRNIAILIDGVPVIGRLDGAIDLSQIPMNNIQRIEIVQGPLSNIYGNNAAGGVINLITKKSQLNSVNASLESLIENIGIKNIQASLGFQSKKFRLGLQGRIFDYDRYPEDSLRLTEKIKLSDGTTQIGAKYPWNPKKQMSYGSSLLYRINDNNNINFKYDFNKEEVSDYDQVRRPAFKPYSNDNLYTTNRNDVALFYNGNFNKKNYLEFTAARNHFNRITEDKRYYHETKTFDSLLYNADTISFVSYYSRLNFARQMNDKFELMSGLTFTNDIAKGDRIINEENVDSSKASFIEYAAYAEVKYRMMKQLQLMASGRYLVHSIYENKFTPSFQLKYDFLKNLTLRASYSQGYRSPDLKELYIEFIDINHFVIGNINLKPEISNDKQVTLTYSKNKYNLNVGLYHTEIKDKISLVEIEAPLKYQYLNFDNYTVYGFQAGYDISIKDFNLQSNANLGYWSTGVKATDIPAYGQVFDMNNNLSYTLPKVKLNINVNHRYAGKQPNYSVSGEQIYINTLQAANYLDASLNKSFLHRLITLTAGVKNITDVQTLRIDGSVGGIHQGSGTRQANQGRSYFVSLKISI